LFYTSKRERGLSACFVGRHAGANQISHVHLKMTFQLFG